MELFNYMAEVLRVVDGDTLDLKVDVGFHASIVIRARLLGINAPERYAAGGREATAHLLKLCPVGATRLIETFKDPGDKYGRWLANVWVGDEKASELMVAAGHATYRDYGG